MTAINSNRAIRGPVTAVPVVAGKGVRLVADTENNRWVVEADETVLWSGSIEASANHTATVSESPNNFEYLRFEYHRGDLAATHTVFRAADHGTTYGRISCSLDTVNIDSTQNNVYMFTGSFSGTTFTVVNHSTKIYAASTFSTSTTSPLTLTRIIGVNRIASN